MKFRIASHTLFQILFHIVLWSIWIGLPIINAGDNERHQQFLISILPVSLTNIPLFLINSEWLIPRIFRRKGIAVYLLALLGLILAFSLLQMLLKEWIIPAHLMRRHWNFFWAVVPVTFVTAISTGYGFIQYQLAQERLRREEEEERMKSELSFLRSQISPHFIFNVLNSIVWLIRSRSEQAEKVTIQLSHLLRYMLYHAKDALVPLEKEVEYLENYIELQKIRFGEDIEIRFRIEGKPDGRMIEPMLLIPFVENAFKHGTGLITDPLIDVYLKVEEQRMVFKVRNKIPPGNIPEQKDETSGIGLPNVQRRLALRYPQTHKLHLSASHGWFLAELELSFSPQ